LPIEDFRYSLIRKNRREKEMVFGTRKIRKIF
jgi:hypothetical protein